MNSILIDWMSYLLRWAHVIAGIAWIGNSFYFMWLDSHLELPSPPKPGVEGSLWMVHSGGFYQVEKRRIGANQVPETLHWFYWEATLTWLTGILMMAVVYYWQASSFLIDPSVLAITPVVAIAVSISLLIASWFGYDQFWKSEFAKKHEKPATIASLVALGIYAFALCHVYGGRGAFIQLGATLGTLMVLNVWIRILPAQRRMIEATQAGRSPNLSLGKIAKKRSVQNSYMTLPVLFMMLSNHYAHAFGHQYNWVVLALLIAFGMTIRHGMILSHRQNPVVGTYSLAAVILFGLVGFSFYVSPGAIPSSGAQVSYAQVNQIVATRCLTCHSTHPTDPVWRSPPKGVVLDSFVALRSRASQVRLMAVQTRAMPLGNKTQMTEAERTALGQWIDQGAQEQ